MTFVIFNELGIPVYQTDDEYEAQCKSDLENGYYMMER